MQGWLSPHGIADPQLARMTDLSRFSASLSTRENMATARKALEAQPADLNQATIDGDGVGVGDGGAEIGLYFCSNGMTSR